MPDGAHFHSLIYRRIVRWAKAYNNNKINGANFSNSKTSPYLWMISSIGVVPAILYWDNTWALQIFSLIFCLIYLWLYKAIVIFQTPKWIK